ncbi:hypothetical protein AYK61_01385 [Rhodococcus sp. SBT000017]|uniref:hypothetical protein n=1 Tax=Rhodococcus sp. SBT000017 TaxID=1803385 RepID=UPI000EF91077|nr:hypothetical protein [Rhodococcus sp. SBT000017]RMB75450.1 hypothetical protein AYK61_01385 [Rhodococcus sp. SBT000017]
MEDTWGPRDLPVLTAVVEEIDRTGHPVRASKLVALTGLDDDLVQRALRALDADEPPYLVKTMRGSNHVIAVAGVTGKARRAAGAWPTPETLADSLIARLQDLANDETAEPETRERAKAGLTAFLGAGRDILVGAAGSALSAGIIGS